MTTADEGFPVSIVTALHLRTKTLHRDAERSGILRDLLRGEASLAGYAILLRNLFPAYQAMERGLDRHRDTPGIDALASFRLDRAASIAADLAALCGDDWARTLPLLDEGISYARRITVASDGDGGRLIAHAYTRYLGDLSGGLILKRLLARSLGLRDDQLSFYDFSAFADPDTLKADYRNALDLAGARVDDPRAVVEEGAIAFSHNIDLSWSVHALTGPSSALDTGTATVAEAGD